MAPLSHYIESALGTIFTFSKNHDSQLLSRTCPELTKRKPSVGISSTELGATSPGTFTAGKHELLGENKFPELSWSASAAGVKSWVLVVEDPDSPLPAPGLHGIFYDIPASKTSLAAVDFEEVKGAAGEKGMLAGGFKYGQNRRQTVWIGPRPVISHGNHRYFFTLIGLSEEKLLADSKSGPVTKDALDGAAGLLAGKVVCWGEYVANFERKLGK